MTNRRTYGVDVEDVLEALGIAYTLEGRLGKLQARFCCPFHDDRTPSMYMSLATSLTHCHGCGWGGNLITFVEEFLGVSRAQAKNDLRHRFGAAFRSSYRRNSSYTVDWTPEQARFLRKLTHVPGRRRGTTRAERSRNRLRVLNLVHGQTRKELVLEVMQACVLNQSFAYKLVADLIDDGLIVLESRRVYFPDDAPARTRRHLFVCKDHREPEKRDEGAS